jgi:NADPH-dependent curcumin reductase CurA
MDLHASINNFGIGVVLRSENPKYQAGDYIYSLFRAFQTIRTLSFAHHYSI